MNENKSKIGILTYIAKSRSKGIKFEDEPDVWYNPTIAAIDQVKSEYIGKPVEIVLIGAKNEFSSMILLEPESKPEEKKLVSERTEVKKEKVLGNLKDLNLFEKLSRIQCDLKVPKNQRNNFANFNYRSMTDILEGIKSLLNKCGVSIVLTDSIEEISGRIYVKAIASIIDNNNGSIITAVGFAREQSEKKGMDEAQITGSASSYARKYALNGLLAIDDSVDIDSQDNSKKD